VRDERYAELHCHSHFSFLDGASGADDLVDEAVRLGLHACAITDHNGFYGVVRFAEAARAAGLPAVFGSELTLDLAGAPPPGQADDAHPHLLVLAEGPAGYARLAQAISAAQLAGEKTGPRASIAALADAVRAPVHGHAATATNTSWFVLTACRKGTVPAALMRDGPAAAERELRVLIDAFGRDRVFVELWDHGDPLDRHRNDALAQLAMKVGVSVVATNNVHYAAPRDRELATAIAAIRARRSLDEIDGWLPAAGLAHLRSPAEQARRFARWPGALERSVEIADAAAFELRAAAPNLPDHDIPAGHTEMSWLRELTYRGARRRYPVTHAQHDQAMRQIEYELGVIEQLGFPGYFLVLHEIVEFCNAANIYCQGRGSAANSAVCYALGVTKADSVALGLLFERFLSPERDGPPDIDLDIEHERREEVIQHVYERYGRNRAAQVANVITYRPRSALREMAKACGMAPGAADALTRFVDRWSGIDAAGWGERRNPSSERAFDALRSPRETRDAPAVPDLVMDLAGRMLDAPRHLGIHSGGMVMADRPLTEYAPVEWARMENRTVLQWDKDDCAAAGLVKFDLLGLGMLTMLHMAVDLVYRHEGIEIDLATIPQEDAVYDLLCAADTVGVFQVESRAQMATLPRLAPREFYDLVVEVALIRPGPIQGGSVHPYLRRRNGEEPVTYLHPRLEPSLKKTLGVPLFQEQLMQMAIDVANFTPTESDQLRQAMSSKRSKRRMAAMRRRLMDGMASNGITGTVADEIAKKLEAFADFGFPESHSVSFAYLVYASSWIKYHFPAEFTAAILNAQSMGFYAPHTLVRDAIRHGVEVIGPDVNASRTDCTLEKRSAEAGLLGFPEPGWHAEPSEHAVRIGLRYVRGLSTSLLERIECEVEERPFADLEDFVRRTGASVDAVEMLATAGAFEQCFGLSRRAALWAAGALASARPQLTQDGVVATLPGIVTGVDAPELPTPTGPEQTAFDLWAMGLSPSTHPTEYVRAELEAMGVRTARDLRTVRDRTAVEVAGVITHRQQPMTAKGTIFMNLEDETGLVNVICPPAVWKRYRRIAKTAPALRIKGVVEKQRGVINLVAGHMTPLAMVPADHLRSRDFR